MKEEDEILRKIGTGNPFRVPDGYFEKLTSEVMEHLPDKAPLPFEQKKPTRWDRIKPWVYMAAMFAGAALIIRVASADRSVPTSVAEQTTADDAETEYINMAVENSMMDDYSLYVFLADSDAE